MSIKPNRAIQELRAIIDQTQEEFATMIGASKDTVVSWENGRNRVSPQMARRIAFATGVDEEILLRGRGPLIAYIPMKGRKPFTVESFDEYRKSYWGSSDEAAARQHFKNCLEALELLFVAASKPAGDKTPCRLPAVVDSFRQWCEQTRNDFQLDPGIQEELKKRKSKFECTQSYGKWREMQKTDPTVCRAMKFVDDPNKSDKEELRLEMELIPAWQPGHSMRGGKSR
jgi:transcriptional regulator with XRE-family HTH domain